MASPFAQALRDMNWQLDEHIGEQIRVMPMSVGDFGASTDAERPAFDVVALVSFVDPSTTPVPGLELRVGYEEMVCEIRRELLAGRSLNKHDEIKLLEQPDAPRMRVTAPPERLDPERIILKLGPIGEH